MQITLKDLRIKSDVSQSELSEKTGLLQPSISRMEKGGNITLDSLERYVKGCGMMFKLVAIDPIGQEYEIDFSVKTYEVEIHDTGIIEFMPVYSKLEPLKFQIVKSRDGTINAAPVDGDWLNYRDLEHFYSHNGIDPTNRARSLLRVYLMGGGEQ